MQIDDNNPYQVRQIRGISAGIGMLGIELCKRAGSKEDASRYISQKISELQNAAEQHFAGSSSAAYVRSCITELQKIGDAAGLVLDHNSWHKIISRFTSIAERQSRIDRIEAEFQGAATTTHYEAMVKNMQGEGFLAYVNPGNRGLAARYLRTISRIDADIERLEGALSQKDADFLIESPVTFDGMSHIDIQTSINQLRAQRVKAVSSLRQTTILRQAKWFNKLSWPEQQYFLQIEADLQGVDLADPGSHTPEQRAAVLRAVVSFDSCYTCTIIPSQSKVEDHNSRNGFAAAFGDVVQVGVPAMRVALVSNSGDRYTARAKVRQTLLTYMPNLYLSQYAAGTTTNLHVSFCSYLDALPYPGFPNDALYEELVQEALADVDFQGKLRESCRALYVVKRGGDEPTDGINFSAGFNRYPINASNEHMTAGNRRLYKAANNRFVARCEALVATGGIVEDTNRQDDIHNLIRLYRALNNDTYSFGKGALSWMGALHGEGKHNKQLILSVLHQLIAEKLGIGCVRNCKSSKDRTGLGQVMLERVRQHIRIYNGRLPKFVHDTCGTRLSRADKDFYSTDPVVYKGDEKLLVQQDFIALVKENIDNKDELERIYAAASRVLSPEDVDSLVACAEYRRQVLKTGLPLKNSPNFLARKPVYRVVAVAATLVGVTSVVMGVTTACHAVARLWQKPQPGEKQGFWQKAGRIVGRIFTPVVAVVGFVAGATIGAASVVYSACHKQTAYQIPKELNKKIDSVYGAVCVDRARGDQRKNTKVLKDGSKRNKLKGKIKGLFGSIKQFFKGLARNKLFNRNVKAVQVEMAETRDASNNNRALVESPDASTNNRESLEEARKAFVDAIHEPDAVKAPIVEYALVEDLDEDLETSSVSSKGRQVIIAASKYALNSHTGVPGDCLLDGDFDIGFDQLDELDSSPSHDGMSARTVTGVTDRCSANFTAIDIDEVTKSQDCSVERMGAYGPGIGLFPESGVVQDHGFTSLPTSVC